MADAVALAIPQIDKLVTQIVARMKKGGRISKTVAFAGGLLSIKPIIGLVDGEIKVLAKGRGNKQANNLMNQEMIHIQKSIHFMVMATSELHPHRNFSRRRQK